METDSEDEAVTIETVIKSLQVKKPTLNYHQYLERLREAGITYADAVNEFDREFYVKTIGMAEGAVSGFLKTAKTQLTKAKTERKAKKARVHPENKENSNTTIILD